MNLNGIQEQVLAVLKESFTVTELPHDTYTEVKYPKFLPVMHFHIRRYDVDGLGQLFIMHTETKVGMELVTVSLPAAKGQNVPYLLIDMMSMKNKDTVMVEYYDCTDGKVQAQAFEQVKETYRSLPDYREDVAWYIHERAPYSLIKRGDAGRMVRMVLDSVKAYAKTAKTASVDPANAQRLIEFRERMISKGNPATDITNKVFGAKGAGDFFRNCIFKV